jgi:hypothetical protein
VPARIRHRYQLRHPVRFYVYPCLRDGFPGGLDQGLAIFAKALSELPDDEFVLTGMDILERADGRTLQRTSVSGEVLVDGQLAAMEFQRD